MLTIAFHFNNLTFRGTEVCVFDYAYYNIKLLNNKSIIIIKNDIDSKDIDKLVLNKFKKEFPVHFYSSKESLNYICNLYHINAIYQIKYGTKENIIQTKLPTLIHCVFSLREPHGNVYASVSEEVSNKEEKISNIKYPYVPHMINLPFTTNENLRKELDIPKDAIVFGRHGGKDTMDINFVREVVLDILEQREDIYFLFAVKPIIFDRLIDKKIIFLDSFSDLVYKEKFINTCDAMLHAQGLGETFGLSILEFCSRNKPIITFNGGWHTQHLKNLGDKAIKYNNKEELSDILLNFKKGINIEYNNLIEKYSPLNVMNKFKEVFLK